MPIPFPPNFDGKKFMEKFNIRDAHTFWIERGLLYCPSLPDLTEADIADCVTDLARKERVDARQLAAKATAKAVPEWATWDAQTANNWGQTNIGIPLAT